MLSPSATQEAALEVRRHRFGLLLPCRVFTNTFEGPRCVSEHSETIHLNAERLTPRAGPAARDMSSTIHLAYVFCRTTRR